MLANRVSTLLCSLLVSSLGACSLYAEPDGPRRAPACHETASIVEVSTSLGGMPPPLSDDASASLSVDLLDDGRCSVSLGLSLWSPESPGTCRHYLWVRANFDSNLEDAWAQGEVSLEPRNVGLQSNPFDCPAWSQFPVGEFDSASGAPMGTATLRPVEGLSDGCEAYELAVQLEPELLDNDLDPESPLGEFYETLQFDGGSFVAIVEFDRVALQVCEEARS